MPVRSEPRPRAAAAGIGTLAMVMTLLLIAHLSLLYSHRALLFEQRASAGMVRAVRAQEAAHAGLDWAVSRLNDPRAVDAQCLPAPQDSTARPAALRSRWDRSLATALPLQPACAQTATGPDWRCHCPDGGAGQVPPTGAAAEAPAFAVTLQPGARTGLWTLSAEGCSTAGPDCGGDTQPEPDSRYRITTALAALGQVVQPPLAALTSVGAVTLADGASIVNSDPASGGTTVHGGSTIALDTTAQVLGPPGQPAAAGLVAQDPPLAAGADSLWRRLFGMNLAALQALPSWQTLACAAGCTGGDLDSAWRLGARALWLDGDLALAQGQWGTAEAPLLLVVRGVLRLGPDAVLHGLTVAGRVDTSAAAGPRSLLRGALVSLDRTTLRGPIEVVRDAGVLERAGALGGALVPVPGSWFDPHTR